MYIKGLLIVRKSKSINPSTKTDATTINAEMVAGYLQQHPEFWQTYPDLSPSFKVNSSLLERQVKNFRQKNQQLKQQLNDLIDVAKKNEQLNNKIQQFALTLMSIRHLSMLFQHSYFCFKNHFQVEWMSIVIKKPANYQGHCPEFQEFDAQISDEFQPLFDYKQCLCGRPNAIKNQFLFKEEAKHIESAIIIPLIDEQVQGLLALGSHNPERYHKEMSTHFHQHIGALLARAIQMQL